MGFSETNYIKLDSVVLPSSSWSHCDAIDELTQNPTWRSFSLTSLSIEGLLGSTLQLESALLWRNGLIGSWMVCESRNLLRGSLSSSTTQPWRLSARQPSGAAVPASTILNHKATLHNFMIDNQNQNNLGDTKPPTKPPTKVSFSTTAYLWQDSSCSGSYIGQRKKST
jgi:hypothetical protein